MRVLLVLTFITVVTPAAFAQSPTKILKAAEKAMGGQRAMRAVQSAEFTGTIKSVSDGSTGNFAMKTRRPGLFHVKYDLGGFEHEAGSNGRSAWVRDSRDGLRTLTGDASNGFNAMAAFRSSLWLDHKKERAKLASAGAATVNGKPVNVILLTTSKNVPIKLYFDKASGVLVRDEIPLGDVTQITDYSDHRKIAGVSMPYLMTITNGPTALEVKFDDIKINGRTDVAQFGFPKISNEPLPDMPTLLTDVRANADKLENLLDTYSYTQKQINREVGKDGVLRETGSETIQLSFYKGNRIQRQVEKNGKPLSEKEQRKVDEDVQKRVEDIEKDVAKNGAKADKETERLRRISVAEVLRASKLINPRREKFRGRDMIVFDFEPDPSYDLSKAESMLKLIGKIAGVVWIDEKDKQVARVEASMADNFNIGGGLVAKLKKGSSFMIEAERVNDEIWLPSVADINVSVRVMLVKGLNFNQVMRFYDYKKFATEVKDARVVEPKSNP
jgi:outer membrane lipoprotein-sorting protein